MKYFNEKRIQKKLSYQSPKEYLSLFDQAV
ncbi:hypothetical protein [Bacillus infantis]